MFAAQRRIYVLVKYVSKCTETYCVKADNLSSAVEPFRSQTKSCCGVRLIGSNYRMLHRRRMRYTAVRRIEKPTRNGTACELPRYDITSFFWYG